MKCLPVISEVREMTTPQPGYEDGDETSGRTSKLFMPGINRGFSSIVLDDFRTPIEGKPINAYGVLDEGQLEVGDSRYT